MKMILILSLLLPTLILFAYYGLRKAHLNTFDVKIRKVEIPVSLPTGGKIQILHLSDMHFENLSITPQMLYEQVKDHKVDMIAITGDQIERKRNITPFMEYIHELKKLDARYGIYVTFGNHDYIMRPSNLALFRKTLEEHGCIVMQNENHTVTIDDTTLNIIGIDDYSTRRSNIQMAYSGVKDGINLVLTHDPNIVLKMRHAQFDYLLSGHFHGGQIYWPKPYHLNKMGKLARMKIIKGLHYFDDKPYYISEGLGQTGVNIRTGSRPEITIHTLKGMNTEAAIGTAS